MNRILVPIVILSAQLLSSVQCVAGSVNQAWKPNFGISGERRCFTPNEPVTLNLVTYNVKHLSLSVYPLDLEHSVKTSQDLDRIGTTLRRLPLSSERPAATWTYTVEHPYKDDWSSDTTSAPKIPPGIYVVSAKGSGVERRTWFAVTQYALVVKRSPEQTVVWAVDAVSGRPQQSVSVTGIDKHGKAAAGSTDSNGLLTLPTKGFDGGEWLEGRSNSGNPVFCWASAPALPSPITVYAYTDRPVYRPGQTVQYTGTVRTCNTRPGPNGIVYACWANRSMQVEIRDSQGSLIDRKQVITNKFGSFKGSFELGAECPLGSWEVTPKIGTQSYPQAFEVQAYKKPEFSTKIEAAETYYRGGQLIPFVLSANYYFGQPVTDAKVTYTVSTQGNNYDAPDNGDQSFTGSGVTNQKGQLIVNVPTLRLPFDRDVTINAQTTDLSRSEIDASGSVTVTAGDFNLTMSGDKNQYLPGEKVTVDIRAADYSDNGVSTDVKVTETQQRTDSRHRAYLVRITKTVKTDAAGNASVTFAATQPGQLDFKAEAYDKDDNRISCTYSADVASPGSEEDQDMTMNLVANKQQYRPGDTAVLTLTNPQVYSEDEVQAKLAAATKHSPAPFMPREAWALITVEGESVYKTQIVHFSQHTAHFRLPLAETETPTIEVHATAVLGKHVYETSQGLEILRNKEQLNVAITTDKPDYLPQDQASYTIETRDIEGRPVAAELSLGVVDKSVYDVVRDRTEDIGDFFYRGQSNLVNSAFSFEVTEIESQSLLPADGPVDNAPGVPMVVASMAGSTYATGGGGGMAIPVRKQFADTAYWNPLVDTDATGAATVIFTMPDNLTTWTATSRGSTLATQVGQTTNDVTTSKPLLLRLELPRFGVVSDKFTASTIVQNSTDDEKTVRVHLDAEGVTLPANTTQTIQVDPHSEQRIDWPVTVTNATSAMFHVTADGGPGAQDAIELTLPTQPDGVKNVSAQCDTLDDDHTQASLDLTKLPTGSTIEVSLAPSIGSTVLNALDDLIATPYGNAEATTSVLVSDIAVSSTLKLLRGKDAALPGIGRRVSQSLQKLYAYQHGDGGWQWWDFDDSDPDMTAYVLWGLIETRNAGYLVDTGRISRGSHYLLVALKTQRDWNSRADWLLPISYVNPTVAAEPLRNVYGHWDRLDMYGKASLTLAMAQTGRSLTDLAQTAATSLDNSAQHAGRLVYWSAGPGISSWRSDDICVTAHVLRALLRVNPHDPLAEGAVRWLLANRDGHIWSSTRASAEAVLALSTYMQSSNELAPNYTAAVNIDGVAVTPAQSFGPADVFAQHPVIDITADQLAGHKTLTVDKSGSGVLYTTFTTKSVEPAQDFENSHPADADTNTPPLAISRTYQISSPDPSSANILTLPASMTVTVNVTANANYKYVMLEEPIPAGCEVLDSDDNFPYLPQPYGCRREVRDNRVVYYFDSLPAGVTQVSYSLATLTPGTFTIIPGTVSLVYAPEVRATENFGTAQIVDKD